MNFRLRIIVVSISARFFVAVLKIFRCSYLSVRIMGYILLPIFLLIDYKIWKKLVNYIRIIYPEMGLFTILIKYYLTRSECWIREKITFEAYDQTVQDNDFHRIGELKNILETNKGLLLTGIHYGPACMSFAMNREGISPVILADHNQDRHFLDHYFWLCSTQSKFLLGYPGFLKSHRSEISFVRAVRNNQPALMWLDVPNKQDNAKIHCLDREIAIVTFIFKLALNSRVPLVFVWFRRKNRNGIALEFEELKFTTIEEGFLAYERMLDKLIAEDPFRWKGFNHYF